MYSLTQQQRSSLLPVMRVDTDLLSENMIKELAASEPLSPALTLGMTVGEAIQILDAQFEKEIASLRFNG